MACTKLKNHHVHNEFSLFSSNMQTLVSSWDLWNKQAAVLPVKTKIVGAQDLCKRHTASLCFPQV